MKNIILINGSPKTNRNEAASKILIDMAGNKINDDTSNKTFIDVRQSISNKKMDQDYEAMQHTAFFTACTILVFTAARLPSC